ncbi:hypothetical protein E8D34_14850 [Nocardioides sp. GY 10113]|uniref:hypothetical protein n=1 Tax=Nocardioides sp. GY 10113 TaxID=2569761 RepID=UPI0010A808BC|nr:hypothetical protein [Nocardioides sp. GY 10113]TIC83840.1 hypothetical protein E8D34_14850 [Nocardioides sp. GY 10113]
MTLEASVSTVVGLLEQQNRARTTGYSLERHYDAESFATGIRESGLTEVISDGLAGVQDSLRESLFGAAATLGVGLRDIARGVANSNALLRGIEEVLRTPLGTAARERYHRGIRAYEREWLPEAETEFTAAVTDDPYLAIAHLMLALTILRAPDREPDAVAPLSKAVRYGTPDEPPLAVGAALLLARLHSEAGDLAEALATATRAHQDYPTCAELGLLRVQLGDDASVLSSSILVAPELVSVAMLRTPDQLEEAAVGGSLAPTLDLAAELRRLLAQVAALPFTSCESFGQLAVPSSGLSPLDEVLEACDLLLRAPELVDALRQKADAGLRAAAGTIQGEHRAELELLESSTLVSSREEVAHIRGQISTKELACKDLVVDGGQAYRRAREDEIGHLLNQVRWSQFEEEMAERLSQQVFLLEGLRAGKGWASTIGRVQKVTADDLEWRVTEARRLLDQLPADLERERQDREARISVGSAEIEALRKQADQIEAEIVGTLAAPRHRHEQQVADIDASRAQVQDLLSQLRTLLARAAPADRVRPLTRSR